jgi:hypothetical protein
MQASRAQSPAMKRITVVCLILLSALYVTAAVAKSITCTYPQNQELTFGVPKKLGGLPPIEFDYSSKVTRFSFRDDNLLLVAMDEVEKTRVRVVISAQLDHTGVDPDPRDEFEARQVATRPTKIFSSCVRSPSFAESESDPSTAKYNQVRNSITCPLVQ